MRKTSRTTTTVAGGSSSNERQLLEPETFAPVGSPLFLALKKVVSGACDKYRCYKLHPHDAVSSLDLKLDEAEALYAWKQGESPIELREVGLVFSSLNEDNGNKDNLYSGGVGFPFVWYNNGSLPDIKSKDATSYFRGMGVVEIGKAKRNWSMSAYVPPQGDGDALSGCQIREIRTSLEQQLSYFNRKYPPLTTTDNQPPPPKTPGATVNPSTSTPAAASSSSQKTSENNSNSKSKSNNNNNDRSPRQLTIDKTAEKLSQTKSSTPGTLADSTETRDVARIDRSNATSVEVMFHSLIADEIRTEIKRIVMNHLCLDLSVYDELWETLGPDISELLKTPRYTDKLEKVSKLSEKQQQNLEVQQNEIRYHTMLLLDLIVKMSRHQNLVTPLVRLRSLYLSFLGLSLSAFDYLSRDGFVCSRTTLRRERSALAKLYTDTVLPGVLCLSKKPGAVFSGVFDNWVLKHKNVTGNLGDGILKTLVTTMRAFYPCPSIDLGSIPAGVNLSVPFGVEKVRGYIVKYVSDNGYDSLTLQVKKPLLASDGKALER